MDSRRLRVVGWATIALENLHRRFAELACGAHGGLQSLLACSEYAGLGLLLELFDIEILLRIKLQTFAIHDAGRTPAPAARHSRERGWLNAAQRARAWRLP